MAGLSAACGLGCPCRVLHIYLHGYMHTGHPLYLHVNVVGTAMSRTRGAVHSAKPRARKHSPGGKLGSPAMCVCMWLCACICRQTAYLIVVILILWLLLNCSYTNFMAMTMIRNAAACCVKGGLFLMYVYSLYQTRRVSRARNQLGPD